MAQAAAASGDHGEARRLAVEAERAADAVTTPERREWALAGVVGALAAAGDAERAERIARGITDAEQRTRALAGRVGSAALPPAYRRRLAGEALATGPWRVTLPALASLFPEVGRLVDAVAEGLRERGG